VVVEAPPASPLVVTEPDLLLEVLVIPLDAPAQLGLLDEVGERRVIRQGREPVFGRFLLAVRPLDEEPLLRARLMTEVIAMGRPDPDSREARRQWRVRTLSPGDDRPSLVGQRLGQIPGRKRRVMGIASYTGRRTAFSAPGLRRRGAAPGGQRVVEDWMPRM